MPGSYAQYSLVPGSYENLQSLPLFRYFSYGNEVSFLEGSNTTLVLKPGYIYDISFNVQVSSIAAGEFLGVLPYIGGAAEALYAGYSQSARDGAPLSVNASFITYIPVSAYFTLQLRTSASSSLLGSLSIRPVALYRG